MKKKNFHRKISPKRPNRGAGGGSEGWLAKDHTFSGFFFCYLPLKDFAHNPIQCTSIVVSTESVIFHHTASRSVFYPSFCVPISETIIKVLEEEHLQVNLQARSDHFFQVAARRGAPLLIKSVTAMLFSWDGQSTIQ